MSLDDAPSSPPSPSPSPPSSAPQPAIKTRTLIGSLLVPTSPPSSAAAQLLESLPALYPLIPHSSGICSTVYRIDLPSSLVALLFPSQHGGHPTRLCIKRVTIEDQCRPHSIELEVSLLLRLAHRNIVPLLSVIQDSFDPFGTVLDLYMPLYAATLSEILDDPTFVPSSILPSSQPKEEEEVRSTWTLRHLWSSPPVATFNTFILSLAAQLFSALCYLHDEAKVAHRDIKADNLLLASDGTLKLIDFGTALDLSSSHTSTNESATVFQVGTGCYRAPELLFAPTKGYDAVKVDMWAAGVTLSHFFTEVQLQQNTTSSFSSPSISSSEEGEDERPSWQRSLWDDSPCSSPDPSLLAHRTSSTNTSTTAPCDRPPTYKRTTLFPSSSGEITLAASIFSLLGLPTSVTEWPESQFFQPPLDRLLFAAQHAKTFDEVGRSKLPYLSLAEVEEGEGEVGTSRLNGLKQCMEGSLRLSAQKRWSARRCLDVLQS